MSYKNKSNKEWKEILSKDTYQITREKGTETPFSGKYNSNKKTGLYKCVCCGNILFSSDSKFDSGTGWPSFFDKYSDNSVSYVNDDSFFMSRVEITCKQCDAHLGHVFDDGPNPTGKRYCIISISLDFCEKK